MTPAVRERKDFRRPFRDRVMRSAPEANYRLAKWRAWVPLKRTTPAHHRLSYDVGYRNVSAHRRPFAPGCHHRAFWFWPGFHRDR